MSAAFSPIMMVGALVLPPISVGMTRRRPRAGLRGRAPSAWHRPRPSGRYAHLGGADRVIDGVDALRAAARGSRRRSRTPSVNMSFFCKARSAGVSISRRVILKPATMVSRSAASPRKFGSISGGGERIGAAERDAAAALRPQQADVAGKAGAAVALAAVVVGHRHAEMQLDVGHVEVGAGFQEAAALGEIRGHRPAAFAPVLADGAQQPRNALQRDAVEVRIVGHVAEHEIRMVLQVLSDAGQMMHGWRCRACRVPRRRRRRTASAVAGSGTRRRRRSPRAGRGSASVPCPAGIRRRPRACLRTGCGWRARWSRRADWRGCPYADGYRRAPRSSVRRSSASPGRCRGLRARRR